jgi:Transcriptional regulator PadR-like family
MTMRSAIYMAVVFAGIMGFMRWRSTHPDKRQRVLQVFLDRPDQRLYGLDIAKLARAKGGSIYPALARLETERWILSDWEDPAGDYPRRRVYFLNPWRSDRESV